MADRKIDPKKRIQDIAQTIRDKADEFGNTAADAAQKAAREVGEFANDAAQKAVETANANRQKVAMRIYRPVVQDELDSQIKMVVIDDDDDRKDIDVCQGSVGFLKKAGDLDVLHLYDEAVPSSEMVFYPQPQMYSVYYQDSLDSSRYISLDCYFDTIQKDKFTELKRIAYDLGAKSCRLESYEETKSVRIAKSKAGFKKKVLAEKTGIEAKSEAEVSRNTEKSIVFTQTFEANKQPRRPELKWFAHDKEIEFLIDSRCGGADAGMTKEYTMKLNSTVMQTMSVQAATKIDKALAKLGASFNFSLEGEAHAEQRQTLVFEIEF